MVNLNISGDKSHLKIFSLILFVAGLILLMFPGIIGFLGIRIAAVVLVAFCIFSFYVSSDSLVRLNRLYLITGMIGGIIVFIFPSLVMVFTGIGILGYGVYNLYNLIKFELYNDKTALAIDIVAILLGLYFIFNGTGAIKQVIRILGISAVAVSCIVFYKSLED
ncbi:MAG: hypothetical protein ACOCV8_02360 [Spirochaetota bacterium]